MLPRTRHQSIAIVFLCATLSACGGGSDTAQPAQSGVDSSLPGSLSLPAPPGAQPGEADAADPVEIPEPEAGTQPLSDSPESSGASSVITGTWRTGCIAAPEAESAPGRFILSASFDDARSETTSAQFVDENCADLFVEFVTVSAWAKAASVVIPSGFQAVQVDSTVESIAVTYHDAQVVASLNSAGYCGVVLEVGISVDLTQCLIDLGFSERNRFGLVMVASGVLYPGDPSTGNGNSPASRPTDVDFTQGHLFVQP